MSEIPPADLGSELADVPRVLVRPAAEESHYFRPESKTLTIRTLEHLGRQNVQVVFSPRYERQVADLERLDWSITPVVLRRAVPFVPLLKSVDAVVCSGGTMFREAAYVGIDAYSIFQGELGAVDLYLEKIGRATIIRSASELEHIRVERRLGPLDPLVSNEALAHDIARLTMQR